MPIFVQWSWKEQTRTFLVVFHFYDDYSQPNLRIRKLDGTMRSLYPQKEAWMSWAPSHVELGLLGELLSYANIIDGLRESDRRELRSILEGQSSESVYDMSFKMLPEEKVLVAGYDHGEHFLVVQLCPEYVDYLRRTLKPYLRSTSDMP